MARLPTHEIESLKREVSVKKLAEAHGVKLKRHGSEWIGMCPFHNDREPSLVINETKNLWHCLGACQSGDSVVDWVMKSVGVSFRHAVELLREGAPLEGSKGYGTPPKKTTVSQLECQFDADAEDGVLLRQVVDFYHQALKNSPDALSYLEKRGLNDPEMIDHFRLGYANRTLGYRLPYKNRQAGAAIRGRLQEVGILRPNGHELFSGSLVVPILDELGRVVEMYGRKVSNSLRKGTPKHLYLPGPHRGVWNMDGLKDQNVSINL